MAADHDPIEIIRIRRGRADDGELAELAAIEVRAGALFAEIGMLEIAADDPPTPEELRAASAIVVAVDGTDRPVGYARVEVVDGHAHLEQLSVDPAFGRRGIGAALVEAVAELARGRGDRELTLTTFRDVAFNAPYYRRLGFEDLAPTDRAPGLAGLVASEADHGLDPADRVTMRLVLAGGTPSTGT
jgi:GNAT superfamily N-acetyltransferase